MITQESSWKWGRFSFGNAFIHRWWQNLFRPEEDVYVEVGRYCMKTFTGPLHIPTYLANIYIYRHRQFYLVYIQYLLSYKQVIHQEKVISLEVWPNMILFLSVFFCFTILLSALATILWSRLFRLLTFRSWSRSSNQFIVTLPSTLKDGLLDSKVVYKSLWIVDTIVK